MAVPTSYPPDLQRLIDAVAEWHKVYAALDYRHYDARARETRIALRHAFEAFRRAKPDPAAEQPKSKEDTRPKVVQLCVQGETETEHAARQVLLEDGSLWERVFDKTSRGWERVEDLPAAARGGPR